MAFALLVVMGLGTVQPTLFAGGHGLGARMMLFMLGSGATTETLPYGSTAQLTPSFQFGTGQIKDGGNNVTFASVTSDQVYTTAALTASQTYTLIVTNPAGDSVTQSVSVFITPPAISAVSPGTATLTCGGTKTFAATATNAVDTGVVWAVDGVLGGNASVGTINAGGVYTAPASAGSHTVSAICHADGVTSATAAVTVVAAPVATSLTPSNSNPLFGSYFTLTPIFSGGTGTYSAGLGTATSGVPTGGQYAGTVGTSPYTLTVTNAAGTTATASCNVVVALPTVGSISPASPFVTASTAINFSNTCTLTNTNKLQWSASGTWGSGGVSDTGANISWTAPATPGPYTITCTSKDDFMVSTTTVATVVAAPVATSLVATQSTVTSGTATTVTPTFSAGTATLGTTGIGSSDISASATSGTGVSTGPVASTTTYTLTVTNAAGTQVTKTCTVTTVPAATASITSSITAPFNGATDVTVTPTFTGATSAMVGTSQGASDISASPTSGVAIGVQTGGFTVAKTYWVRATNAAGDFVDSSITVTPQVVAVSAVSPAAPTLTYGANQTFTASVSGSANTGITWSADAGTMNAATGSFTAPPNLALGVVSSVTGTPSESMGAGLGNGAAASATFNRPVFVAADATGNLYVADYSNHAIRMITPAGVVTTYAGGNGAGALDGPAASADKARCRSCIGHKRCGRCGRSASSPAGGGGPRCDCPAGRSRRRWFCRPGPRGSVRDSPS